MVRVGRQHLSGTSLKKVIVWLGVFVCLTLLSVLVSVWLLLMTEAGRLWAVESLIEKVNASEKLEIRHEGLATSALGSWRFDALVIERAGEPLVEVVGAALSWQPKALLRRLLIVDDARVEEIRYFNQAREDTETTASSENSGVNELPFIEGIQVKRVEVERLRLGELFPNVDQQTGGLNYRVRGAAHWQQGFPAFVEFDAESNADISSTLLMEARSSDWKKMDVVGSLQEDPGGFFGTLLRMPSSQGVSARFDSSVSLSDDLISVSVNECAFPFLDHDVDLSAALIVDKSNWDIDLSQMDLVIDDQANLISGSIKESQLDILVEANEFPLDIASLWVPQIESGQLSGAFSLTGALKTPLIKGNLTTSLVYDGMPISFLFDGAASRETIQLDEFDGTMDDARVQATGRLDLLGDASDLSLSLNNIDTTQLETFNIPIPEGLSAVLTSAEARLQGELANPDASLTGAAEGAYSRGSSREIPFSLSGSLTKFGDRLTISELSAESGPVGSKQGKADISGEVDMSALTGNLKLEAVALPVSLFELASVPVPTELEGDITASLELTGKLREPELTGVANMTGLYKELPFDVEVDGYYVDKQAHINRLILDSETLADNDQTLGGIELSGDVNIESLESSLKIVSRALSSELAELLGVELPAGFRANMDSDLVLDGNLKNPKLAGEFSLAGIYQSLPFALDFSGHYLDQSLHIDRLSLNAADKPVLSAFGAYDNPSFDFSVHADQLPSELFSYFGWHIEPGLFQADLRFQGSLDNPILSGQALLETALPNDTGVEDEQDAMVTWKLVLETLFEQESQGGKLQLVSIFSEEGKEPSELVLRAPTKPYVDYFFQVSSADATQSFPLEAAVVGDLNLESLSIVLDSDLHLLTGKVRTDMTLSGRVDDFTTSGGLAVEQARYENTITGTVVSDINCSIAGNNHSFQIARCAATDGQSGEYAAAGKMQLPIGGKSGLVDLTLDVGNTTFLQRSDIENQMAGSISLEGDFEQLYATGELEVAPLTAYLESATSSGIPKIDVVEASDVDVQSAEKKKDLISRVNLDLAVTATQQAFLRGHGLEAELAGEVTIKGTLENPIYDGEFRTVRGKLEIFNKIFALESGSVQISNSGTLMSIPAVYSKDGQEVRAEIVGSSEDFELRLTATPTMPEEEILAFIIFGKPLQNISPYEAIQLASSVQTLRSGGRGFFDPIGATRELLGVDTLSIGSGTTENGDTGMSVGVGKYISDKVFLEIERTPDSSQPWKGNIEIELAPNLKLESSTGNKDSIGAAELKWKRDY